MCTRYSVCFYHNLNLSTWCINRSVAILLDQLYYLTTVTLQRQISPTQTYISRFSDISNKMLVYCWIIDFSNTVVVITPIGTPVIVFQNGGSTYFYFVLSRILGYKQSRITKVSVLDPLNTQATPIYQIFYNSWKSWNLVALMLLFFIQQHLTIPPPPKILVTLNESSLWQFHKHGDHETHRAQKMF